MDQRDKTILMLADRVYGCSRLLTAAAERLGWDNVRVREIVELIQETTRRDVRDAGIEEAK